jgi:hypothetical protein
MGALLDLALSERSGSEPQQTQTLAARAADHPVSTGAEAATKETKATEASVPYELEYRRARAEGRLHADATLRVAFDVANAPLTPRPGEPVSVMLAVRTPGGIVSAELHIPRERWDSNLFFRTLTDTAGRPQ